PAYPLPAHKYPLRLQQIHWTIEYGLRLRPRGCAPETARFAPGSPIHATRATNAPALLRARGHKAARRSWYRSSGGDNPPAPKTPNPSGFQYGQPPLSDRRRPPPYGRTGPGRDSAPSSPAGRPPAAPAPSLEKSPR